MSISVLAGRGPAPSQRPAWRAAARPTTRAAALAAVVFVTTSCGSAEPMTAEATVWSDGSGAAQVVLTSDGESETFDVVLVDGVAWVRDVELAEGKSELSIEVRSDTVAVSCALRSPGRGPGAFGAGISMSPSEFGRAVRCDTRITVDDATVSARSSSRVLEAAQPPAVSRRAGPDECRALGEQAAEAVLAWAESARRLVDGRSLDQGLAPINRSVAEGGCDRDDVEAVTCAQLSAALADADANLAIHLRAADEQLC